MNKNNKKIKYQKNAKLIALILVVTIVLGLVLVVVSYISNSNQPKISEAKSKELAARYYSKHDGSKKLDKTFDLKGGWCYSPVSTSGEFSTGGVMLCIDDTGQGYEVASFMNYPEDGDSISEYVASLESEYVNKPKSNGQKSWDIKVDL